MKVALEPNTVSDNMKAFLNDPRPHEHIKDPQNKSRGELLRIYTNT